MGGLPTRFARFLAWADLASIPVSIYWTRSELVWVFGPYGMTALWWFCGFAVACSLVVLVKFRSDGATAWSGAAGCAATRRRSGSYWAAGEGKFFFTMIGRVRRAGARHHPDQRTMAGLAAARARGRTRGRPAVMDAGSWLPPGRAVSAVRAHPDRQGPRRKPGIGIRLSARRAKSQGWDSADSYLHSVGGFCGASGVAGGVRPG